MTYVPRRGLPGVDTSVPNIARMNDYFLGGKDNFAADRQAADELLAIAPEIKEISLENRAFLGRAVRFLAEQGIRQFIDIGSGLPTQRNSHEVARSVAPDARVVYVDKDPVVLSHARAILIDSPRTAAVAGDILRPEEFLTECRLGGLIDLERPLAVVICGALHFIPHSDDPFKSIAWLRDAIPSGSYLAISHVVFDTRPDVVEPIEEIYQAILERPGEKAARTRDQVLPFFDGFELLDPGLVYVRQWHPENPLNARAPEKVWMVGGVGRKA
ncbi:SAM-dependent methyltransferase [Actinoallomurus purpureus]|uniref:SAM-dependent methyltransferase n=1 Tax=Actinoallomurus purpureus TaxID=478114 RepID=UPI00209323D6|nr:SAM-dependent methyltransferase [Actinoallomurus purpureus]MCO6011333.1 SAM-dependent methyltransferase [Actinoallomurus purpureus]